MPILPETPEDEPRAERIRSTVTRALTGTGSSALARVVGLMVAVVIAVSLAPAPWAQVGIVAALLVLVEVARKRTF